MQKLITHFSTLQKNIRPSDERIESAQSLPPKVRKYLEDHETFGTVSPHSRLAGSYAQKMCVGDVKDVDFLVRVAGTPTGDDATPPKKMIADLKTTLGGLAEAMGYASDGVTINAARRSVHVHFVGEDFHIDAVPCIAPDGFDEPVWVPCKAQGEWVKSHPIGYVNKLNEINSDNGGNVKPLGRMLKHYVQQSMKYMRPKSYWLGALLLQIIDEKGFDKTKSPGELFHWLVSEIHAKYKILLDTSTTKVPAVKDPMLGHNITWNWERNEFESFMRHMADARDTSTKALADDITQEKAIGYWQKLFGDAYFPTSVEAETKALVAAATPGSGHVSPVGRVLTAASAASLSVPSVASATTRYHGDE